MTDQRIQYSERMVGANHPSLSDTLNRLTLVDHNTDGSHKSVQSVVTGSRAIGTTYQNTTGRLMKVVVSVYNDTIDCGGEARSNASTPPTTVVAITTGARVNQIVPLSFEVLPGNYYKIVASGGGTAAIQVWTEWY